VLFLVVGNDACSCKPGVTRGGAETERAAAHRGQGHLVDRRFAMPSAWCWELRAVLDKGGLHLLICPKPAWMGKKERFAAAIICESGTDPAVG